MAEPVFMVDGEDPEMEKACVAARRSFKYFWRELYWERRRIIPGLEMAAIKLPFTDGPRTDGNPEYEQMWCTDVDFDGEQLSATLVNEPNWLQSVKTGDSVTVPAPQLTDWMLAAEGIAYGGFTVNFMRAGMGAGERKAHDRAWGLDFGDPNNVQVEVVRGQKRNKGGFFSRLFGGKPAAPKPPANTDGQFRDHPMCTNMLEKIEEQLKEDPSIANSTDQRGWTLLHNEAMAGNHGVVQLLLKYGAKVDAKTPSGKDAATLANTIGWDQVAAYLANAARAS